jgi:hypothetical protein|tara:strand:+ start:21034 stop:22299 length:1266 start_codon:yes stop_codon:yes gene_type:complete
MNKPLLIYQAPIATRSGYGDHSRDILKSIFKYDKFDVITIPQRWGNTPQNQLNPTTEFGKKLISTIGKQITKQPDVFVQMTVPNEFQKNAKFSIGITAGIESTIAPKEWIDGCNRMDLVIVPTEFSKKVLLSTVYDETDKRTNKVIRQHRITTPIEVLHEGVDLSTYLTPPNKTPDVLEGIDTDSNYLFVGHWLKGDLGHDRKDTGMMIQTFCTIFQDVPKKNQPGLILKTSMAGFSVTDREAITAKISEITQKFGDKCPPIHLLFGDLTEEQMSSLYHHPKVKAMISFTKGEGYGRPLCEFTLTGKPIIVSNWSGHVDFLPKDNTVFLEGELKNIHPSAADNFLLKEAKWFNVDYSKAASKIYDVEKNYKKYLSKSKGLVQNTKKNFDLDSMHSKFADIIKKYVNIPEFVALKLPEIKKL